MPSSNPDEDYSSETQSYSYDDGRTRIQMSSNKQSWSSRGRASSSTTRSPMPPMPSVELPDIHAQMHNAAMAHHAAAIEGSSSMIGRRSEQPIRTRDKSRRQTLLRFGQRKASERLLEQHESSDESSRSDNSTDCDDSASTTLVIIHKKHDPREQGLQPDSQSSRRRKDVQEQSMQVARDISARTNENNALLTSLNAQYRDEREQRRRQEQHHEAEHAQLQELGARMDKRMQVLEENEARARARADEKDREMRQLREENTRLNRGRVELAEKHRREMADILRHDTSKADAAVVIDTSAIERVIREVQNNQLSKQDVERIIQDRVASQLDGIARTRDIEAASSRMQKALEAIPAGASADQVERAVNKELGRAYDRVMKGSRTKIVGSSQSPQQHVLEGAQSARIGRSHDQYQTEEQRSMPGEDHKRKGDGMSSRFVLPKPANPPGTQYLTSLPVTELPDDYVAHDSHISTYERNNTDKGKRPLKSLSATAETPSEAVFAKRSLSEYRTDDARRISGRSKAEAHEAKHKMRALPAIGDVSKDTDHALVRSKGIIQCWPDTASQMSGKSKTHSSHGKKKLRALPGIEEMPKEPSNALVRSGGGLMRRLADTASRVSGKLEAKSGHDSSRESTRALRSVRGGSSFFNTTKVRSKTHKSATPDITPEQSTADTTNLADRTGGLQLFGVHPDRASQISTWGRNRGEGAQRVTGSSSPRQIAMSSSDEGETKALVRVKNNK